MRHTSWSANGYPCRVTRGDERDITVKGLDAVKSSARVYLEAYTSILGVVPQSKLVRSLHSARVSFSYVLSKESFYGKPLIVADRDMVEMDSDAILEDAQNIDVSFLVVGDPFGFAYCRASLPF